MSGVVLSARDATRSVFGFWPHFFADGGQTLLEGFFSGKRKAASAELIVHKKITDVGCFVFAQGCGIKGKTQETPDQNRWQMDVHPPQNGIAMG